MAEVNLPKVSASAWRTLRARAASAPSTKFTPAFVAAALGMASPNSARDNVVSPMRKLGLIEEDGSLTPRGNKWRVDSTYAAACDEIIDELYPDELKGLVNGDGEPDKTALVTWFQHKGLGNSNANGMASTYALIASRVPPEPPSAPAASPQATGAPTKRQTGKKPSTAKQDAPKSADSAGVLPVPPTIAPDTSKAGPTVHLDIQIHIPATADADQIDAIFASMAKHLYP